jgi:crotonobetainyl-CoA:carnitine CoA-transferase CaiB-like acyl-CoA transferase
VAKPLSGIVVLEMGTFITGPAAGMLLADLGADVIKVEQPGAGDPFRAFNGGLYSPHFQTYNRNKRSVALDTKSADDLARFDGLVAKSDVFIQNFRPGVANKLNVDAARLQAINPGLVYCAISGFGASGPEASRPAFDTVAQAADAVTGFYAAQGVLAALYERTHTGKGRIVETSMFEAMCHVNLDDFTHYLSADQVMGPYSRPRVSQSYVFECSDGQWIALHMSSPPKFWENLASAVGRPQMLNEPMFSDRQGRIENYEAVYDYLAPLFKTRTLAEWRERLEQGEVPHAPVRTSAETLESPQARHLEIAVEAPGANGRAFRTVRSPISFDGERSLDVRAPPLLGEHNSEILGPTLPGSLHAAE